MRILKTRDFVKFARRAKIADSSLRRATSDLERGLIDADLGGGVFKQRVAREGGGKSGGFRVLLVFRAGDRAVFLDGFAKNERANIEGVELRALRRLAAALLAYDDATIARALSGGALMEVESDGPTL